MNQVVKVCNSNEIDTALSQMANSELLVLISPDNYFEQCVNKMKELVPNVPNIGISGQGYFATNDCANDIILIGYQGCEAITDVITDTKMPIYHMSKLEQNVQKIAPGKNNTVCLDFTTGNDSIIITTLNVCLQPKGVHLVGATAGNGKVSCNGIIYTNSCVYALLKNKNGSIYIYKENIYEKDESMPKFIATKVDTNAQKLITIDNQSAASIYQNSLHIKDSDIEHQTFKNPIGRLVGNEIYIISIKATCSDGSLECYKRTNSMDSLTILKLGDYADINDKTVATIKHDLSSLKGVFSINCVFRYLMFNDLKYMSTYLSKMNALGSHVGLVGYGEHYNNQHVNQTMTCFAFD